MMIRNPITTFTLSISLFAVGCADTYELGHSRQQLISLQTVDKQAELQVPDTIPSRRGSQAYQSISDYESGDKATEAKEANIVADVN
ncbi:hypothetical protein [Thaumasiovibrio sp. DFM-14]|uniref:hypothetical protein n=1 Tax=Thaumasiovibrio sp. DFM-14 TaxID=3384792 RepID=UPI00399F91D6